MMDINDILMKLPSGIKIVKEIKKDPKQTEYVYNPMKERQMQEEMVQAIFKEYQENIRKSGMLRSTINIEVDNGMDVKRLLLMACECISLMTGDKLFYQNIKGKI
ncbi:hypothetical protein G9F71_016175 [Clostridium sp. FP2]|uniref:hypothetical protein n=1 Tax=Clostridium sp. FP2 TaxID=2724481 RepID=UPI0013E91AA3|nr:hypothetical protein [Clostridium sp. FP2]MBZ9624390.1 hypothetical protein [Clostridium sp. FP2]